MKQLLIIITALMFHLTACQKKDKSSIEKVEPAPDAVSALTLHPGRERVKLTWKQPASEEAVVKYRVFWNNNADSLEIPAPSIDSVGVMILNLAKKNYTFLVHAYTAQGVKSQGKIVSGKVYGGQYESALVNRAVEQAVFNDEAKTAVITWEAAVSGAIASEIKYTNSMGTVHTETVLSAVKNTILNNYKSGSAFAYRTLYLPQAAAIDTFYTAYDSVEVNPIAENGDPLGSGWVQYAPLRKIHLDDAAGLQIFNWTAYKSVGDPMCADYRYESSSETETFRILTTKSNRSEIRIHDDYSTGSRQFQGYLTIYPPLNDECVMQIFGSIEGATQMMIRGYAADGGSLRGAGKTLVTNMYGKEVRVNVIHLQEDKGNKIQIYINGVKKAEIPDNEAVVNYMKYGNYGTMKTGEAVVQWRNARVFRNGLAPE